MSNRTLVELNHDNMPDDHHLTEWAEKMRRFMRSGDKRELPEGVTFKHMRHHSEPDLDRLIELAEFVSMEHGFVVCEHCGHQTDTDTLDYIPELRAVAKQLRTRSTNR